MRFVRVLRGAGVAVPVLLIAVAVNAQAQGTAPFPQATRAGQPPLTSALARLLSRDVTDKVIIERSAMASARLRPRARRRAAPDPRRSANFRQPLRVGAPPVGRLTQAL
jgi:hypothetical protein